MTETTLDTLLAGRVRILQPRQGYRAGLDAILLAAAVQGDGEVLDLGCGVGTVMFCSAERLPQASFVGLERDTEMARLAEEGARLNELGAGVQVETGDAFNLSKEWQNRFDEVVSNPPFFEPETVSSPGEGRKSAYIADEGLKKWLNAMVLACKPKGRVTLIHRAHELAKILSVLDRQTGEITVLPLHPRAGEPAKRILVTCRKGLRSGPVTLLPSEFLHEGQGSSDWLKDIEQGQHISFSR